MKTLISLEFTTTSCNRPDILNKTFSSYTKNLKGIDFTKSTLYINVDPSPNSVNITKIEMISKKYFGTVIINYADSPNFAKAAHWCFSQVKEEYFFHLEDDWELIRPISIHSLFLKMKKTALQCVLNKKKSVITIKELGEPTFMPSLISTHHWKKYLNNFSFDLNPEYQMKILFRDKKNGLSSVKSIYYDEHTEFSLDIGRTWLKKNKLVRNYIIKNKWSPWINWKKQ